jgi:hypothetical protein
MIFVPGLHVESEERCTSLAEPKVIRREHKQAKRVITVFQPIPKFCEAAKIKTSREVFKASTP